MNAVSITEFLKLDASKLCSLPRMCDLVSAPLCAPTLPTSLDLETTLSYMRVNALAEARSRFAVAVNAAGAATYVGITGDGSSGAAVVEISRRGDSAPPSLVTKVALLEEMPYPIVCAQASLIEMFTSIVVTGTTDMVYLDAVRDASDVLFADAGPYMSFNHAAAVAALFLCSPRDAANATAEAPQRCAEFNESVGMSYFQGEHLLAGIRLLARINAVGAAPVWYAGPDETAEAANVRWAEDVDTVFERFVEVAAPANVRLDNVIGMRAPRIPRTFGHQRNAEHINEVVVGSRLTLLRESRIAVAFTPIVDYFAYPVPGGGAAVLHVVAPRHDMSFGGVLREGAQTAPSLGAIFMVRSVLAQVLLSLEAAQAHLRFTHYDLHLNNVMISVATDRDPEFVDTEGVMWRYARPTGKHAFVVPATDSADCVARIIDFGRSRCDDPRHPGDDDRVASVVVFECAPCERFNDAIDMRALAHDIVVHGLLRWAPYFRNAGRGERVSTDPLVEECFQQLVSVLEDMAGVRWWSGWNTRMAYTQRNGAAVACPRSLCAFIEMFVSGICTTETVIQIRTDEFMRDRPKTEHTMTPTTILDAPFFTPYRMTRGTTPCVVVVEVADATHASGAVTVVQGEGPPRSTTKRRRVYNMI